MWRIRHISCSPTELKCRSTERYVSFVERGTDAARHRTVSRRQVAVVIGAVIGAVIGVVIGVVIFVAVSLCRANCQPSTVL